MAKKEIGDQTTLGYVKAKTHLTKVITLNDLFARDDVNEFLADMDKEKPNIKDAIIIYVTKDNKLRWEMTQDITIDNAIGLLERTKLSAIEQFSEENE